MKKIHRIRRARLFFLVTLDIICLLICASYFSKLVSIITFLLFCVMTITIITLKTYSESVKEGDLIGDPEKDNGIFLGGCPHQPLVKFFLD